MGEVLLDEETLARRIRELGEQITRDYAAANTQELVVIGILRGSVVFLSDLIRSIQQQFESNFIAKYTLQSLSRQHHVSPSHLSHQFKQATGTSVMGYLNSCRFAAAKRYLAETDFEIGRVVELCGFSDNSNFSRSFKNITGLTPTEFRIQFRHK